MRDRVVVIEIIILDSGLYGNKGEFICYVSGI